MTSEDGSLWPCITSFFPEGPGGPPGEISPFLCPESLALTKRRALAPKIHGIRAILMPVTMLMTDSLEHAENREYSNQLLCGARKDGSIGGDRTHPGGSREGTF